MQFVQYLGYICLYLQIWQQKPDKNHVFICFISLSVLFYVSTFAQN